MTLAFLWSLELFGEEVVVADDEEMACSAAGRGKESVSQVWCEDVHGEKGAMHC